MTEEKLSQTLRALEIYDGTYKREYVDAAIEMKEEITPYLIGILEKVLSNPSGYVARQDYHAHIYALMLLGHFGEHRAHKTIVELFSLPGDIPDKLFGDIITEDLPIILLRTCDGSLDMIRSLVLNREADDFCRGSAIGAITFGTLWPVMSAICILKNSWTRLGKLTRMDLFPQDIFITSILKRPCKMARRNASKR